MKNLLIWCLAASAFSCARMEGNETQNARSETSGNRVENPNVANPASDPEMASTNEADLTLTNEQFKLIVGGYTCVTGLYGVPGQCASIASATVGSTISGVVKSCADSAVKNATKEDKAEHLRDECVRKAVTAALNAAYMSQLGMCLPVVSAVQSCVSSFTNALGYGFNSLWCSTYPNDCYSEARMREIMNKKYIAAAEAAARRKKFDRQDKIEYCFKQCMNGSGYVATDRQCSEWLGAQSNSYCQKWVGVCLKCDHSF